MSFLCYPVPRNRKWEKRISLPKEAALELASRAAKLGPVRTMLRLCHAGDQELSPLSRLTRNIDSVDLQLKEQLGEEDFYKLLCAAGSAFRLDRQFSAASFYFHRAGCTENLKLLSELAWEFGDYAALQQLDRYAKELSFPLRLSGGKALKSFIVEHMIPALEIGGDQYRGFTLDQKALNELAKIARSIAPLKELIKESVIKLEKCNCVDIAKLYILANHSEDVELIARIGKTFSTVAATPRHRVTEIVESSYPGSRVTILRNGDSFSVRPKHRFVIEVQNSDGTSFVLKEILARSCDVPGATGSGFEEAVLSSVEIDSIPKCDSIVELKGIRFLKICCFTGKKLYEYFNENHLFSPREGIRLCHSLASSIASLHEQGAAHFDLRDENILWDGEKVSIIGFDKAAFISSRGDNIWIMPGPAPFVPPEVASSFRANQKADCFQMGLLFSRVLFHRHPFGRPSIPTPAEGNREAMLIDYAIPALYLEPAIQSAEHDLPADVAALIDNLLSKSPEQRCSARETAEKLEKYL